MLTKAMDNISCYNLDNGDMLREVMVKIGLERIDTQERITVEVLLDSSMTIKITESEFYFIFDLFSIFLFLELRVRVSNNIT